MARPKKCRKVCHMPAHPAFGPVSADHCADTGMIMSIEEYETIRLIDQQNLTQEECAQYMNVARTTVQKLYNDARKKLANFLVEGIPLQIGGGDYQLCNGRYPHPGCQKKCPCLCGTSGLPCCEKERQKSQ